MGNEFLSYCLHFGRSLLPRRPGFWVHVGPRGIYGGRSDNGTHFPARYLVFPCKYLFDNAPPYSFVCYRRYII